MNKQIDKYEPLSTQMQLIGYETQARPLGNMGMDDFTERLVLLISTHIACLKWYT